MPIKPTITILITEIDLVLIWMQECGINRTFSRTNFLTLSGSFKIPDSAEAILTARVHPTTIRVEADRRYVLGNTFEINDRMRCFTHHIIEFNVLIRCDSQICSIRRYFHCIYVLHKEIDNK